MKLYNNDYTNAKCHRVSLFSPCIPNKKVLYYKKKINPRPTNKSYLSSNQKKSRYHFLKSNKNKYHMYLKKSLSTPHKPKQQKQQKQQKEQDYLLKLRQEAYADLHSTIQLYNDEFIRRMRTLEESSNLFSVPSTDSLSSSSSNSNNSSIEEESQEDALSMQNLVGLFEAGTIKDYSQLIEWESYQNPPNYFECQGEYGDLW